MGFDDIVVDDDDRKAIEAPVFAKFRLIRAWGSKDTYIRIHIS